MRRVDDVRVDVERVDEERVDEERGEPERDDSDCDREVRTFCGGRRRDDGAAGREELVRVVLRRACEGPVEP